MTEYVAVYKCRLCGETIEGCHLGKNIAIDEAVSIATNDKGKRMNIHEFHCCENDGIGITDFIGFKKVGDD